jgi:hypothetical protein
LTRKLRADGWKVLRIWQHQLRCSSIVSKRVQRALRGGTID